MFGNNDYMMDAPGGPGGAMVAGKWLNKRTGASILVRDAIIGDNGMEIMCSDGRVIGMEEFSRDYIQASDDIYDSSGKVIGHEEAKASDVTEANDRPPMFSINDNSSEDDELIEEDWRNLKVDSPNSLNTPISTAKPVVEKENDSLIKKLFDKIDSKPQIKVDIDWADFPEKEISTLINFLDVPMEDVSKYIYSTFFDEEEISKKISDFINDSMKK